MLFILRPPQQQLPAIEDVAVPVYVILHALDVDCSLICLALEHVEHIIRL